MSYNIARAFEIPDDGLLLENGAHIVSGDYSPMGIIAATSPTYYMRKDGVIWYHSGVGNSSAWRLLEPDNWPTTAQVPVFNPNGTIQSVTFYQDTDYSISKRMAKVELAYDTNLNPTTETVTVYSLADGVTIIKTITRTYNFVNGILTGVSQVVA